MVTRSSKKVFNTRIMLSGASLIPAVHRTRFTVVRVHRFKSTTLMTSLLIFFKACLLYFRCPWTTDRRKSGESFVKDHVSLICMSTSPTKMSSVSGTGRSTSSTLFDIAMRTLFKGWLAFLSEGRPG